MKTIKFNFNERKAVQAAARLIQLSGGEMNYMAMIKLLFIADREALLRYGRPITGDRVVAMQRGFVLSRVFDFVSQRKQALPESEWHKFIPRPRPFMYTVRYSGEVDRSQLSDAELEVIDQAFTKFRGLDQWDLAECCHSLPEWQEPKKGTSEPVPFERILEAENKSSETIAAIAEAADAEAQMDAILAQA